MDHHPTSNLQKSLYWIYPLFIFFICFSIQSFCLHIATKEYIDYMNNIKELFNQTKIDTNIEKQITKGQLYDVFGYLIGKYTNGSNFNIPIIILDLLGVFPLVVFSSLIVIMVYFDYDVIGIYNKTFIIASIMAVSKGVIDMITIIPDSNGWNTCKKRLGDQPIHYLNSIDFSNHFFISLFNMVRFEIFGLNHHRIRYCADMLISGHTYFVVLFSIASYKIVSSVINKNSYHIILMKIAVMVFIIVEMIGISLERFHYTIDIAIAIMLVILLWDSNTIELIAYNWSQGYSWRTKLWIKPNSFYDLLYENKRRSIYASNTNNVSNYLIDDLADYEIV